MQNEKKSGSYRFNFFDVVLIIFCVAVIAAVAVLVVNSLPDDGALSGNVKVSYVITVSDLPTDVSGELRVGQRVYDAGTGEIIGTVSSVIVSDHTVMGVNQQTGEMVPNAVPGRCDLNITLETTAKYDGSRYSVNGKTVACGEKFEFRTSSVALSGICISMNDR